MDSAKESENRALLEAVKQFGDVEGIEVDDSPDGLEYAPQVVSVPEGRTLESLKPFIDELRTRPERKRGTSTLTTIDSFVAQVNRSKDGDTVIFADVANRSDPKLLAVFDYNQKGPEGQARFGQHRALYKFPVSDQWKAWTAKPLENLSQVDFAEFLENRIMDVTDPSDMDPEGKGTLATFCRQLGITLASPQRLMELSRGLTVHADHRVIQNVNVGTGEAQIQFAEEHKDAAGAPIKVPGGFAVCIPVFLGGAPYNIPVRLRYRVKDGQVRWTLQPQRLDVVWDDAVTEAVNAVTTKTELTTLVGTPEA